MVRVFAQGDELYALVSRGWDDPEWGRSLDGGFTWEPSGPPSGQLAHPSLDPYEDPGPSGPLQACASDGTCWVLHNQRVIERLAPDGQRTEEFSLSESEFADISTRCSGAHVGILRSIVLTESASGPYLVASLGADGVLTRQLDGQWIPTRVLSASPPAGPVVGTVAKGLLLFGPILALVLWLVGRRRWPAWPVGLAVVGGGWMAMIVVAGGISFWAGSGADVTRAIASIEIVGMFVTTVIAIVVARRQVRIPRRPDIGAR